MLMGLATVSFPSCWVWVLLPLGSLVLGSSGFLFLLWVGVLFSGVGSLLGVLVPFVLFFPLGWVGYW